MLLLWYTLESISMMIVRRLGRENSLCKGKYHPKPKTNPSLVVKITN